ncbi:hypothetical protein SAMN04488094_102543 [Tropicimonas isoalkanivorans]|uniref:Uncharacterized protein n=1 Tax=Tropicimonas isoalkanivorans TaxID=441112 RepID=A0A1I1GFX3_9RHOB|nr:hypothetical protein SAMN04488094_102543 [Tropicimonas isoalkanivorans]
MFSIGLRSCPDPATGMQSASVRDRRVAPFANVAPTSGLADDGAQTIEALKLGALAVRPISQDGPTAAERTHSEAERAVHQTAPLSDATGTAAYPGQPAPAPPLRQFAEIPSVTTAEIQRLREEVHDEATKTPPRFVEASAGWNNASRAAASPNAPAHAVRQDLVAIREAPASQTACLNIQR